MVTDVRGIDFGVVEHFQAASFLEVLHDEYSAELIVEGLLLDWEWGAGRINAIDQHFDALLPLEVGAVVLEVQLIRVKSFAAEGPPRVKPPQHAFHNLARFLHPPDEAEDQTDVIG